MHLAAEQPISTFSIDVDTGAYANVRRFLNGGQLPPQDAVRVEEMINYFDYQYAPPTSRDVPFRVATEVAPAPWNPQALLMKIGIKGFDIAAAERPPANLVFLIDVSGSMQSPDKLPLLKNAFRLLADQLTARDRVSMVVYAGSSGVVLEPTAGDQKHKIRAAIDRLEAGGSTNGAEGIERAYQLAHDAQIKGGINRVVLATDGDFNVGVVDFEALVDMARTQRSGGVALTTLGFGTGNYNDQLLERLADAGNGNYSYVDTLSEARKVLVSELSSTLFTIAKDVKIQVEFNPADGARIPADRLREPHAGARRFQQRQGRRRRDRRRVIASLRCTRSCRSARTAVSIRCATDRSRPRAMRVPAASSQRAAALQEAGCRQQRAARVSDREEFGRHAREALP